MTAIAKGKHWTRLCLQLPKGNRGNALTFADAVSYFYPPINQFSRRGGAAVASLAAAMQATTGK
ncbi:hypothetical protein [Phormidium sp. CCY1219]|uniref:hypothetical protein n=1 Tax=Phormidium sp. CCY1219 TaxID=2886104 RepID=UPI002D1EC8A6|nr:hypothetical protein [Phormidium sp. CCY1219]MEB3828887.1 hypothetical protein [Phormidium sp. CCY1219]